MDRESASPLSHFLSLTLVPFCLQAFNTAASEEGDPVFTSVFKTELVAQLHKATAGSLQINIGASFVLPPVFDASPLVADWFFRSPASTTPRRRTNASSSSSRRTSRSPGTTSTSLTSSRYLRERLPAVVSRVYCVSRLRRRAGSQANRPSSSAESRPPARRLPGIVRPITAGKLLRRGGPSTPHPSVSRPVPLLPMPPFFHI